jgi:hypothetical protein
MSTKENAKGTPGPVQFRWRSLLGVSVGLFLLFGILEDVEQICMHYVANLFGHSSTPLIIYAFHTNPNGYHVNHLRIEELICQLSSASSDKASSHHRRTSYLSLTYTR